MRSSVIRVGGARVVASAARPARRAAALAPRAGAPAQRINGFASAATKTTMVEDVEEDVALYVDDDEEFEDEDDGSGMTTAQVQQLLSVMCDETDVAELEVRLGSFELRVVRSTEGLPDVGGAPARAEVQTAPGAPTIPAPAPGTAFASTASMDGAYTPAASVDATLSLDDESDDDGGATLLVGSPKVGILRRGKYVKGKRVGKGNVVEVGAEIKKGQVLGFVEQLGTFAPVEAPQAGELVDFLVEDGDPVEFRQPVVEFAPFFGGHIIGDSKHA